MRRRKCRYLITLLDGWPRCLLGAKLRKAFIDSSRGTRRVPRRAGAGDLVLLGFELVISLLRHIALKVRPRRQTGDHESDSNHNVACRYD